MIKMKKKTKKNIKKWSNEKILQTVEWNRIKERSIYLRVW